MGTELHLSLILVAAFVAVASPGPGVFAIAGASMSQGRRYGLAMASGMTTGSLIWGTSAALGLGTLIASSQTFFEVFRYVGSGYLLFLAFKSARAALKGPHTNFGQQSTSQKLLRSSYMTGLAIHLTNPKAIFFFSALYAVGMPKNASPHDLIIVVFTVSIQTALILHSYALLMSLVPVRSMYLRTKRWFDGAFAIFFGGVAIKAFVSR